MKYLILLLSVLLLIGCEGNHEGTKKRNSKLFIETVDKCEYVIYIGYGHGGITHKGDCSNPIHAKGE